MHPMLALFLRITVIVTVAIVALVILGKLLQIVLTAAVIAVVVAALGVGGFFLYNLLRPKANPPALR